MASRYSVWCQRLGARRGPSGVSTRVGRYNVGSSSIVDFLTAQAALERPRVSAPGDRPVVARQTGDCLRDVAWRLLIGCPECAPPRYGDISERITRRMRLRRNRLRRTACPRPRARTASGSDARPEGGDRPAPEAHGMPGEVRQKPRRPPAAVAIRPIGRRGAAIPRLSGPTRPRKKTSPAQPATLASVTKLTQSTVPKDRARPREADRRLGTGPEIVRQLREQQQPTRRRRDLVVQCE